MTTCPDCAVKPGELHQPGCDIERCPACGGQRISCECRTRAKPVPWTGVWPGTEECNLYGWYAKLVPGQGWVPCTPYEEGATHDLNRLMTQCRWNRKLRKWVMP